MAESKIAKNKIPELLKAVSADYTLYGPKAEVGIVALGYIHSAEELMLDYRNSTISAKELFLHVIGKAGTAQPLAYLGFVFALAVGFSGMLLYQMHGHILWHSALVPVIFLVSAIASGLAVVLLLSGSADPDQTRLLSKVLAVVVGVDLVLALTEVLTLAWSSGEKAAVAEVILSGGYGFLFIGVYLIVGLALPLVVLARQRTSRNVQVVAAVLVLVGTLAMRYVIVTRDTLKSSCSTTTG